jgi:hypothetical protein
MRLAWLPLATVYVLTFAACARYVVPKGDGEGDYSPHAVQGRIAAVEGAQLTVASDSGEMLTIETPPDTRFYKVAGGVVLRQELVVGQRVRVWFDRPPAQDGTGPRRAAVIILASLDPADDWPAE